MSGIWGGKLIHHGIGSHSHSVQEMRQINLCLNACCFGIKKNTADEEKQIINRQSISMESIAETYDVAFSDADEESNTKENESSSNSNSYSESNSDDDSNLTENIEEIKSNIYKESYFLFDDNNQCSERIIQLLNKYHKWIENRNNKNSNGKYKQIDIYELICSFYSNDNINCLFDDYYEYINSIDIHKLYIDYNNKCNIYNCKYVLRQYRNHCIYTINNEKRVLLYHNINDNKSIVIAQILDILHNITYHLIDIGLRCNINNNLIDIEENKYEIDNFNDEAYCCKKLMQLKTQIMDKTKVFKQIITQRNNKYMTKILSFNNNNLINIFGYRLYYHLYYQNNNTDREILPGTKRTVDNGNYGYKYKDWYIHKKYLNIKEEIFKNKGINLSLQQWNCVIIKSQLKLKRYKNKINSADFIWERVYGICRKSVITIEHIISLLLYTNYPLLSKYFRNTYRRFSINDKNINIINRHSEFANWGKLLLECVEVFGNELKLQKNVKLYHIIDKKVIFNGFSTRLCIPTSTTSKFDVVVNYACSNTNLGDGIIISLQNNKQILNYFDCDKWSDYPCEFEKLFVGGFERLQIVSLYNIKNSCDYSIYITSMKIFELCVMGRPSPYKILKKYYQCINKLIRYKLCNYKNSLLSPTKSPLLSPIQENLNKNEKINAPPIYMVHLFNNLCYNIDNVQLNLALFNDEYLYKYENGIKMYGYLKIKRMFFYENYQKNGKYNYDKNWIKMDVIKKLFGYNCRHIDISCTQMINKLNKYEYIPSIRINDNVLTNILSEIKNQINNNNKYGLQNIVIRYPNQRHLSLVNLVKRYEKRFIKYNFQLLVANTPHKQYGNCTSFCICKLLT